MLLLTIKFFAKLKLFAKTNTFLKHNQYWNVENVQYVTFVPVQNFGLFHNRIGAGVAYK
jgi:hypothetical protein